MENLLWDDASTFNWSSNQLVISGGFDVDEVLIEGMNTSEASQDLGRLDQILESVNDTLDPDLFQLCSLPPVEDSGSENFPNLSSSTGNISSGESENHDSHRNIVEVDRPMRKRKSGEFRIVFGDSKRPKSENCCSSIEFGRESGYEPDTEVIAQVKEMIYRAAALRPVSLGVREEAVERPKRKNVRISSDPQTVAARHRRERISERLRVLQKLVPGGSKMDTASMLDEAANYLKFLKSQVSVLELAQGGFNTRLFSYPPTPLHHALPMQNPFPLSRR